MKKIILILGFVLGLSFACSLNAQLTVRSGSVKFTLGSNTLTISNKLYMSLSSSQNRATGLPPIEPPPVQPDKEMLIAGDNNNLCLGTLAQKLKEIYVTTLNAQNCTCPSDRRYKTNITDLTSALGKIMQLRPVRFDYREEKDGAVDSMQLNRMGLIAQELEAVVPEVVHYSEIDDIYSVDYISLIPLLIKTAQEQQAIIAEQQDRMNDMQAQIEELQTLVLSSEVTTSSAHHQNNRETAANVEALTQNSTAAHSATVSENKLWSNTPNPFKQETHIRYALTESVQNAQLCIYNLNGEQIACHRLSARGQNEFVLRAGNLRPGIYLYSLIADGQVVDTHRMVVTE